MHCVGFCRGLGKRRHRQIGSAGLEIIIMQDPVHFHGKLAALDPDPVPQLYLLLICSANNLRIEFNFLKFKYLWLEFIVEPNPDNVLRRV